MQMHAPHHLNFITPLHGTLPTHLHLSVSEHGSSPSHSCHICVSPPPSSPFQTSHSSSNVSCPLSTACAIRSLSISIDE